MPLVDLTDFYAVLEPLHHDLDHALNDAKQMVEEGCPIDQRTARTLVRTFGSLVDGLIYQLKSFVLTAATKRLFQLQPGEQVILEEQTYEIDNRGVVVARPKFVALLGNVRFTFRVFARASGSAFVLDSQSKGWQEFQSTVELRNRIMHPKCHQDLVISKDELRRTWRTITWFAQCLNSLLRMGEGRL